MTPKDETSSGANTSGWDARELLTALATGHVRLVPDTAYGLELVERIAANVKRIVGVKEEADRA